jgi:hypothetical protein
MKAMEILLGALVVLVALGGMAMAAGSATTTIDASLSSFIEITAPADPVAPWVLVPGVNHLALSGLKIESNDKNTPGWTVQASTTGGLATPMEMDLIGVSGNYWGSGHVVDMPGSYVPLAPLAGLVAEGVNNGAFSPDVTINQPVTGNDLAGNYHILLTFIGSA